MIETTCNPEMITLLNDSNIEENSGLYGNVVKQAVKKILPPHLYELKIEDKDLLEDQKKELDALLPLLHAVTKESAPTNVSFAVISKFRPNAFKFFFELITRWLMPGKRLNVVLVYSSDFRITAFGDQVFTYSEVVAKIETTLELEELKQNLPIIQSEVRLGMQSSYYARRILEVKGLTADAKTALIQEHIAYLIGRLPDAFDRDLLTEMQHVLVICRDEFKEIRESRHLSRIISIHYLFRKSLQALVLGSPEKRHLSLKLFHAVLNTSNGEKNVLGVLVGINFLQEKEVFEERHLLNAIKNYIPKAHGVEGSFFSNRRGNENICTLYLEIEKDDGEEFTTEEIRTLRRELPTDLKDRIEHLMHPVFMLRNEEEVMRNVLSLSNQIKYLHDLPQMIISFDKQTHQELFFTIILARVVKPGSISIQEMFRLANSPLGYIHDRSKMLGFLRKRYAKEANVFAVKLLKGQFLRKDHSIDLNKARQAVVDELNRIMGEIRDFNGGMISKQNELLCALRQELEQSQIKYNDLLLENFFYSLTPDLMRTVLDPKVLKSLFLLLSESIETGFFSGNKHALKIQSDPHHVFAVIKSEERNIKDHIQRALQKYGKNSNDLASAFVSMYDISYVGVLYITDDKEEQQAFIDTVQSNIL